MADYIASNVAVTIAVFLIVLVVVVALYYVFGSTPVAPPAASVSAHPATMVQPVEMQKPP